MANVIRLKRASGSDPTASDLVSGEPAVRTDTGELFFKKDDGSIAKVAGAGGGPDFKYLALRNAANNGAASFPNADFTLVTSGTTSAITPTAANTLLVSVNGVIQKPNTGTSTPSQGFALSGSTIKFGANISAAPDFILYQESGGIGEPSDDTVSEVKLKVSNSPVNGYFLSAQSGNNGGLTWAAPVATSCTGNSATATALATARTINGTSFDGTANITVTAAAGTLTGTTLNSSVVTSSLTSLGDLASLTVNGDMALTGANYNVLWDKSDNALEFADNAIAKFGTDGDLAVYYNSTSDRSIIASNGARLDLRSDAVHITSYDVGETMATFTDNGEVELYYDNSKKFNTRVNGIQVQGRIIFDSDTNTYIEHGSGGDEIELVTGSNTRLLVDGHVKNPNDNSYIFVGASNDLGLVHDGSNSIIKNATNSLFINSAAHIYLGNADNSEYKAKFHNNSSVELYFDNSKKFETTSTGVHVDGELIIDGIVGDLKLNSSGAEIDFNRNGPCNLIMSGSGTFNILGGTPGSADTLAKFIPNGAVELYHNNSKKLETTSSGISVTGNVEPTGHLKLGDDRFVYFGAGGSTDLYIGHQPSDSRHLFRSGDGATKMVFQGGSETMMVLHPQAQVELYFDNSNKFATTTNGVQIYGHIDMSDNQKIRLGGSQDLQIFHNGSDSIINEAGTGTLRIQTDGSNQWEFNGANFKGNDGRKIILGDSSDLQIYHDGNDSYIDDAGVGSLLLRTTNNSTVAIKNSSANMARFLAADAVELYHNGTKKLETTSTGVTFNGTGAILVPKGTTAQRPTGANGHVRYNETTNALEGYINGAWVNVKATGLAEDGNYSNNTQATADDLWAYWDCDSTSTTRAGGDSGAATLYGVTSQGGKISNSWDRGTSATNGVLLTSMPTSNNFTLMFQLYRTSSQTHSATDGAAIVHLDGALSGGTPVSVILGYDGTNGVDLRFGGNGWVNDGETVIGNFSNNNWYHMVITRSSGTTWKFYLDGSLMTTRTENMTVGSSWMLGNYSRVNGNGNTNAHYFRGRFDEIAVWDRTLTAAEISAIYNTQNAGTALL